MSKENCIELCPKYEICQRLIHKGEAAVTKAVLGGYGAPDAEYLTEDGEYIAGWQMDKTITDEVAELLLTGGHDLISSGTKMGESLLANCHDGPRQILPGRYACQSEVKNVVDVTNEDIDSTEL